MSIAFPTEDSLNVSVILLAPSGSSLAMSSIDLGLSTGSNDVVLPFTFPFSCKSSCLLLFVDSNSNLSCFIFSALRCAFSAFSFAVAFMSLTSPFVRGLSGSLIPPPILPFLLIVGIATASSPCMLSRNNPNLLAPLLSVGCFSPSAHICSITLWAVPSGFF